MTLATRCPTCGTVFRVVQDQLRVSQGWVRCGRCSEAFNALESMVEVPTVLAPDPRTEPSAEPFPPTDFGPTAVMEWPDTTNVADGEQAPVPAVRQPAAPPLQQTAARSTTGTPQAQPAHSAGAEDDSAYVTDDPTPGYTAPPLDGIWATAPYFHNGSVPSIALVLDSAARPGTWRRLDYDSTNFDQDALGWPWQPAPAWNDACGPGSHRGSRSGAPVKYW